ncbi:MAG TPA: TIGR02206 family membrane protein [Solirubrobacteraceae bacterium]|jgi:hypothetical integral membrane protein (TIGR02206 family)
MRLFSLEHIAAIAVTVAGAVLVASFARHRGSRGATTLARALAVVILAGFLVEQLTYAARGEWSLRYHLPLQLSDVVTLVAIAALWRPRRGLLTELVWFWALTASLQAVLTPDLDDTFPDVLYFTFFATHSGAILAASLLVVGMRLTPRPWSVWRAYAITVAVAGVAGAGCLATGGNYMFLRRKPAGGSLLGPLGPWPWYIASAAVVALAMLLVLELIARALARHVPESRPAAASGA